MLWVAGGWVGGWVGGLPMAVLKTGPFLLMSSFRPSNWRTLPIVCMGKTTRQRALASRWVVACLGEVGGWVGGWLIGKREEIEAVGMRCCWMGGVATRRTRESNNPPTHPPTHPLPYLATHVHHSGLSAGVHVGERGGGGGRGEEEEA